jgi:hypothetical protein
MATDATSATVPAPAVLAAPRRRARESARDTLVTPQAALVTMLAASVLLVALAAAHPSILSPPSRWAFPFWMTGPLGWLTRWYDPSTRALEWLFSLGVAVMFACYVYVLRRSDRLTLRFALGAVLALHVVYFLAPPLPLTDVFNYLNYGRMEIVHHLNPYATMPVSEPHGDPSFQFSNWHRLLSPYGPLFTILTFAAVPLGVAASFWAFKAVLMVASLLTLWLVWRCAALLGRDPLRAVLFVGLNPVVLAWGLGGDHNDFILMALLMAAVYLLLEANAGRAAGGGAGVGAHRLRSLLDGAPRPVPAGERGPWLELAGGFLLIAALAVKASIGVVLPVVVLCVPRRLRVAGGMAVGAVVFGAATLYAFGTHLPNLSDQSQVITAYAIPNLLGFFAGAGGETHAMSLAADALLLAAIACAAVWGLRSGRWITACGVTVLALLLSLGWLLPWYVYWLLPFAALTDARWLRITALAFTLFLLITWAPITGTLLHAVGFDPTNTPLGHRHQALVEHLL